MHIQFGRLVLLYICLLGLVAQGQVIQFPVTEKLDSILKIFRGDMDNLIEMQKNFIGRNEYENADNCSKLFEVANEAQMMGGQLESLLSLHQIIESEKSIKAYDKLFAKKTVQNDIKKVLAYSTVSQLGYMFLGCGVGAYSAGVFHVITHAFFKALLFLGAGSVIHGMHEEQNILKMGGLLLSICSWIELINASYKLSKVYGEIVDFEFSNN